MTNLPRAKAFGPLWQATFPTHHMLIRQEQGALVVERYFSDNRYYLQRVQIRFLLDKAGGRFVTKIVISSRTGPKYPAREEIFEFSTKGMTTKQAWKRLFAEVQFLRRKALRPVRTAW